MDQRHYRLLIKLTIKIVGKDADETVMYTPLMSSNSNDVNDAIYINTTKKLDMGELKDRQTEKIQEIKENESDPNAVVEDTFIKKYKLISGVKNNNIFKKGKGGMFGSLIPGSAVSFFDNKLGRLIDAQEPPIPKTTFLHDKLDTKITTDDGDYTALEIINFNIKFICDIIFKPYSKITHNGKVYKIGKSAKIPELYVKPKPPPRSLMTRFEGPESNVRYFKDREEVALKIIGNNQVFIMNHIEIDVFDVTTAEDVSSCTEKREKIYEKLNTVFGLFRPKKNLPLNKTIDNRVVNSIYLDWNRYPDMDQRGGRIRKKTKRKYPKKYTRTKKRRYNKTKKYR
jgi:hypothetical protein